jgi:hypothetical protein
LFGQFGLSDSLRVYRLQRKGVSLDLERSVTEPRMPLWGAWLSFVTQQAMGQPTYVLYDAHDGEAFVQVRYRPRQAAADIVYMAPALSDRDRAPRAWLNLLDGACVQVAAQGIQRVFANLPQAGAETEVFQQAGFSLYAAEDVFRRPSATYSRPSAAATARGGSLKLRPLEPGDWPALQKLCVAITPQRVRQAEGGINVTSESRRPCRWYVLSEGNGGDLAAAARLCSGGAAHWLRLLVHPDVRGVADDILDWGLSELSAQAPRPVYCSVRKYEGGIRGPLEQGGFEPYESRSLVVRHTVAWIKSTVQDKVPALAKGAEAVPPAFRINGEAELDPANGRLAAEGEM